MPALDAPMSLSVPEGRDAAPARSWKATLALGFRRDGERTRLAHRAHTGPLRVQKPFFPEGPGVCHVYVLHPPGGLVGGDSLELTLDVGPGAHALVTTPAAGKIYRSPAEPSRQVVEAQVGEAGTLEWLPQETIAFDQAHAHLQTRLHLARGARAAAWEILCLGRPAALEAFARGSVHNHVELYVDGQPRLVERSHFAGGTPQLHEPWGLSGRAALGTFFVHPASTEGLEAARTVCHGRFGRALTSATLVDGTLVCRALDDDATQVRERFIRTWHTLRPTTLGRTATAPRIWAT